MSIFLSNDMNYHDQQITQNQSINETDHINPSASNASETNLGQVIRGEVVSIDKNSVQIALANQEVISAKVDSSIHLILNSSLEFSVDRSNPAQIILHPIQSNSQTNPTIINALNMAGIPVNARTGSLVQDMMKQGMSIDKNTLQTINRESMEYSNVKVEDLLALHKLGIPVNQETTNQLQNCLNMNQQLLGSIQECSDSLLSICNHLMAQGNEETVVKLLTELVTGLQEEQDFNGLSGIEDTTGVLETKSHDVSNLNVSEIENTESMNTDRTDTEKNDIISLQTEKNELIENNRTGDSKISNIGFQDLTMSNNEKINTENNILIQNEELSKDETKSLDLNVEMQNKLQNPDLMQLLNTVRSNGHIDDLEKIVHAIQKTLQQKWSIDPQKMIQSDSSMMGKELDKIYESILQDTNKIKKTADQLLNPNNHLSRTTEQLKGNIDFLHYMNQTYQYVQIPLKMSNRYQNSELYVYTNKKNLAQKKNQLSAVLHLDMDHLGPVDVFVNLTDTKVSTKFILEDESALQLIEDNIQLLNDRLNKKGFTAFGEVVLKETKKEEEEISNNETKTEESLYKYSFDVKA